MNPIRIFRHAACEPPGRLGTVLDRHGCPYEMICLDEGVPVPAGFDAVAGLVFMGGPGNVNEPPEWMRQELVLIRAAAEHGIPMLGICLGAQLIGKALGGTVRPGLTMEVGWHPVERIADSAAPEWFAGLPARFEVFQWHAHTFSLPPGAVALLRGRCAEVQAFAIGNILAMQFHLEITVETIRALTQRYGSDMEPVSECVQDAATISADLQERTRRLHEIADRVFGRWVRVVRG
jgi:GMP synthase-like glutamine amidotransferase